MSDKIPVSVIVSVKNEEIAIEHCLLMLSDFNEVVVVDSRSNDRTVDIARKLGATVVEFDWNGLYPKKKQWCLENIELKNQWVFFVDADEYPSLELVREIASCIEGNSEAAFDIKLLYRFRGKFLRFGHQVTKRCLVKVGAVKFPEFDDLQAPGMGELEGHYQPVAMGPVGKLKGRLLHDDPDGLGEWVARHNRYSDWEAFLQSRPGLDAEVRGARSRQGRLFRVFPMKPLLFFFFSYVFRLGFLDGRAGFDYAFALSWYYWLTDAKRRDLGRAPV